MPERSGDPAKRMFELSENEGEDKVVPLAEAIRSHVKPSAVLQVQWQAGAAISEILRQFSGTKPDFTLVASIFSGYLTNLVTAGLTKKLIISICTHLYPKTGPIKPVQKAYRSGELDIEFWSLCSLQQRMQAGAQGLPFAVIRSLRGSSMAEDNHDTYSVVENPFDGPETMGVAKALVPDVSIIHCIAADRYGNAIPFQPIDESVWGPRASKAVIVTTEKLVSTNFIRQHSHMVRLPGFFVDAVAVTPLGIHPSGLSSQGLEGFDSYHEDFPFMEEHRAATATPDSMQAWLEEWVLECPNHEAYLSKLGQDRVSGLIASGNNITETSGSQPLPYCIPDDLDSSEYTATEMMVISAARKIRESVRANGYKTMQFAVGTASLAAVLAYYQLKDEEYGIDLISGIGEVGLSPSTPDLYLMSMAYRPSAKMLTDNMEAHSVMIGGAKNKCLSALGAAQIDRQGRINSTLLSEGRFMVGAGGANDAATMCSEILVAIKQSSTRLKAELPYVSCPGHKVKTLVTDLGIFEKGPDDEFELVACHPNPTLTIDEQIQEIRNNCGWELKVADKLTIIEPPSGEELVMLRLLDPKKLFLSE